MTTRPVVAPKKLIEVALPLDKINEAAAREKSIRHGHPSTLHLWWARRPLAAARAVLFAQLVNDPSWKYSEAEQKKPQVKGAITRKRNELFKLIEELVKWENTTNESVLSRARAEIKASWRETCEANKDHPDPEVRKLFDPEKLPAFHDPFAGGGSIPLEAQRLGLEAHATDLNPVAVLINKAMIEIPPRFAGRPPVGPIPKGEKQITAKEMEDWSGGKGLAEDVRRYGAWMRAEAEKRIGHLYAKVKITKAMVRERPDLKPHEGQELTILAWLWARTVASPNPAARGAQIPLTSTFLISTKQERQAWAEIQWTGRTMRFVVQEGQLDPEHLERLKNGTRAEKAQDFICALTRTPVTRDYVRGEAKAGRMGARLMAIVAEGKMGRVYLSASTVGEIALSEAELTKVRTARQTFLSGATPTRAMITGGVCSAYGLSTWGSLFTDRQVLALSTLAELAEEARVVVRRDAILAGMPDDGKGLEAGGTGATAYGEAIGVALALATDRLADRNSSLCGWDLAQANRGREATVRNVFARQAMPMTWDFVEVNVLNESAGSLDSGLRSVCRVLECLRGATSGEAHQEDAAEQATSFGCVISTDPPYYDNINYADLSDFFYVWLRPSLRQIFPGLFATIAVPKAQELVVMPYRHGSKTAAEAFFLDGMTRAMHRLAEQAHPAAPVTIYYAFKQSETKDSGTSSTGWEAFLEAVRKAGFAVVGTWPMRTELANRMIGSGTNALASSIVLVCRKRAHQAPSPSRRDFLRTLERELPSALAEMTSDPIASIAPVDLAQAAIGPGMAVFSKYRAVLEADGSPMSVHSALIHINKAIDDYFAHAEGDLDADTRFCIGWFQQYGFETGPFGEADVLARAKGTSVDGVKHAGVVESAKGKVRLRGVKEYTKGWDPAKDERVPVWEACHQMCRALGESEQAAGKLLARMPEKQDAIRQLAYRLYTLCERKKWAEEARAYNELVSSWPAIVEESQKMGLKGEQLQLLT